MIVDDERLARRELRSLLEAHKNVIVVGEAETLRTAAEVIRAAEADTVFLDIQLGDESGLDLCPQLDSDVSVIFVTAYDQHAIRAFELHALDYLLKPVSPERLAKSLERLEGPEASDADAEDPLRYEDFLFLRVDGRMQFVRIRTIAAITAEADWSTLRLTTGETLQIRKPLQDWERRLPASDFVRVHRGAIVNLNLVERIEDWFHASYRVYLRGGGEPLPMSRRYAALLRQTRS